MKHTIVTEENWRHQFNYTRCKKCRGQGTLECHTCGKHTDDCSCLGQRNFTVCDKCDGEGNQLVVDKKEVH